MLLIDYVDWFYNLRFTPYLGQLSVQFAALLSCHYCNSALAVCLCLTLANKINDDDDDFKRTDNNKKKNKNN